MANITLQIPDSVLPRVVDALATFYGYDASKDGTKAQFAKAQIINNIKNIVRQVEEDQEVRVVKKTKQTEIETNITIS